MKGLQRLVEEYKRKNPQGKVILHVGAGQHYPGISFPATKGLFIKKEVYVQGREVKEGELHVCFEPTRIFHDYFLKTREKHADRAKLKESVIPVLGGFAEADSTPDLQRETASDVASKQLKNAVADEIHIHNVLNWETMTDESRLKILEEAARLIKQEGSIYVAHTLSPVLQTEKLAELAERAGLEVEMQVKPKKVFFNLFSFSLSKKELRTMAEHMGSKPLIMGVTAGAYLAKLTKKTGQRKNR